MLLLVYFFTFRDIKIATLMCNLILKKLLISETLWVGVNKKIYELIEVVRKRWKIVVSFFLGLSKLIGICIYDH